MLEEMEDVLNVFNSNDEVNEWLSGGSIVHGYSMVMGPDGVPVVREFGNVKYPVKESPPQITEAAEPLTEVINGKDFVRVIAEIPGVSRDDVKVNVNGQSLVIEVDSHGRKYRKSVRLPAVKLGDPSFTYNNGIFEAKLPKV